MNKKKIKRSPHRHLKSVECPRTPLSKSGNGRIAKGIFSYKQQTYVRELVRASRTVLDLMAGECRRIQLIVESHPEFKEILAAEIDLLQVVEEVEVAFGIPYPKKSEIQNYLESLIASEDIGPQNPS